MKKPYFNQKERMSIRQETYAGVILELNLAYKKLERTEKNDRGCIGFLVWKYKLNKEFNKKFKR